LAALGIAYTVQNVAMAGYQIFVRDPAGVRVEFNFDVGEAPPEPAVNLRSGARPA